METQIAYFFTTYGLKVIGAIIILILGRIAAGMGKNITGKILKKAKQDQALVSFIGNLVYILILAFTVIAALAKFGIQTASFVAVIGAVGLAIGFALQGSLSNFAAGVMILIFKPFRLGDFVAAGGETGTVKEIGIFTTTFNTPDNVKVIVPNGKLFGDVIKNFSSYDNRRIDLVIGIGYGSDIGKAIEVIGQVFKEDEKVLEDPAPQIAVSELADSSVNLIVRPWVKNPDYWPSRFELTKKIKEAFDENGIEIPFPQRVVHTMKELS